MAEMKCLNPWDPQSKRQYRIDGVYATLNAGHSLGGQAHGICYMKSKAIGCDLYNQVLTGDVTCALTAEMEVAGHSGPKVLIQLDDVDVYNESGKGYWMNGFGCLRAEGENRPSRPGHVVVFIPYGLRPGFHENNVLSTMARMDYKFSQRVCYEQEECGADDE